MRSITGPTRSEPPSYDWLTPSEAALRLGVPVRAVYRLINEGVLAGYRIAGEVRLLAHEVDAAADAIDRPDP
jgi:excisionase family DNA binding protein